KKLMRVTAVGAHDIDRPFLVAVGGKGNVGAIRGGGGQATVTGALGQALHGIAYWIDQIDIPVAIPVGHHEHLRAEIVRGNITGPTGDIRWLAARSVYDVKPTNAAIFPHIATVVGNPPV